jgi:mono/diheme cytochrome c family protein
MKKEMAALSLMAVLLIASVTFAQEEQYSSYKYQGDSRVYEAVAKVPEKARTKRNPLEQDPDAIAAGQILFEQHCSECHGGTGDGSKKAPSLRAEEVQKAPPGTLFWILTNGVVRRGMPVWSKLPEPQRWQLVSFIKSLAPSSPSATEKKSPRQQ